MRRGDLEFLPAINTAIKKHGGDERIGEQALQKILDLETKRMFGTGATLSYYLRIVKELLSEGYLMMSKDDSSSKTDSYFELTPRAKFELSI